MPQTGISLYALLASLIVAMTPHPSYAGRTMEPSNALRHEHVLLDQSLANLEKYLKEAEESRRDPVRGGGGGDKGTVLRKAMLAHGLEWRDSRNSRAGSRWSLAYLLNPEARAGIISVETRARLAWNVEKIIAADPAFATGRRVGRISAHSRSQIRTWISMGKRFAGRFETYYPRPSAHAHRLPEQ